MRYLAVVCVSIAFFLVCNATRTDIIVIYQPTFAQLKSLADSRYLRATKEYTTLNAQITSSKTRLTANLQTNINNLKAEIVNATKIPNITPEALACVKKQQTLANGLTTTFLTNACNIASNNSALTVSKARFSTLSGVANNAVSWCGSLNPLESQNNSFDNCLGYKVTDLNRQINIVEAEYNALSNATLAGFSACIAETTTKYLGNVPQIRYNLNMCFVTL